ncbi:MAG: alpha/beta fold hydrolase [Burkholderiaceae bacterium]|nr:alpha/beta fold hydrolase [Burkholderiaceae bacterium]
MMRRLLTALIALIAIGIVALAVWLHRSQGWHPLAAFSFALLVPVVFDAALLGVQFLFAAWFRSRESPHSRYGFAMALRAWGAEIAASLRTFFWAQIRYGDAPLPSAEGGARTPVLLVHGYVCNRGIWHPFAQWLAARGHPVESVNLEPVFGTIDDYVPIVADGVRRLRERTAAARIAIVAHSMGGVVVRAWLATEGAAPVCSIVTLGTPHAGTRLARFGYGRNVAQMIPGGRWLGELVARESPVGGALFTTIWSPHDNIVMPQQASQQLAGATSIPVPGRGHLQLAYDAEVWRIAAEAIDASCGTRVDANDAFRNGCRASSAATPPGPA